MARPTDFDVVVAGAGPAGSATARWLAQSGCRVALVERSRFDLPRIGESLAPSVQPLLRELGVWDRFVALDPLPSWGTRSRWGDAIEQTHSHIMNPYGRGWHVDRLAFDRMLAEAARAAGAQLQLGRAVVGCNLRPTGDWLVRVGEAGSETRWIARVLIDATGRIAQTARSLGAKRLVFDRLVGVASQLSEVSGSDESCILVETTDAGWWYSAPVPGRRMMAMLMTDADVCGRFGLMAEREWDDCLRAAPATQARLRGGTMQWGPRVFSAISQRLHRRDRSAPWLAVGDAALAVDPVSGSGVVRALRGAKAAASAALELLQRDQREIIGCYEAECDGECAAYLQERAAYYGIETRWQRAEFWRRRSRTWPHTARPDSARAVPPTQA